MTERLLQEGNEERHRHRGLLGCTGPLARETEERVVSLHGGRSHKHIVPWEVKVILLRGHYLPSIVCELGRISGSGEQLAKMASACCLLLSSSGLLRLSASCLKALPNLPSSSGIRGVISFGGQKKENGNICF